MNWWARAVYGALVWQERRQARRAGRRSPARVVESETAGGGRGTAHLETGRRGERLVYWYLRRNGYIVVARNRRPDAGAGELDLVGWDGPVLAFVEVKTRTTLAGGPPETTVGVEQRRRIMNSARTYLRRLPKRDVSYRFDIASVLWDPEAGYRVRLVKDAFRDAGNGPDGRRRG
ncbi:MAG TPA: YraN family protein [Terriglobia bacterium]|nr:YraN family protein [Terriglobia bacterium]